MTMTKEYRSPNCTLVVQGFGDGVGSNQLLSIVINAECHFIGVASKLQGGRAFLESLAQTVSSYAQESLSGIVRPIQTKNATEGERITLESIPDTNLHRLTWYPEAELQQEAVILDLSIVQLFDLVEAVDQFLADPQTLPDVTHKIQPLSRNYRKAEEPTLQKVLPAVLGAASLGVTAFAIYLLPIPTVKKPEVKPQPTPSGITVPTPETKGQPNP